MQLFQQIIAGKLTEAETSFSPEVSLDDNELLHNLPVLSTPLIGRQNERASLKSYLTDPHIRLVSIVGVGGIGKTHLGLSLAYEILAEPALFDGIFFVPLGAVNTRQHLILAIAEHLNLVISGVRDPEPFLLSHLKNKKFLIILDNFEQLLAEVDLLERILGTAPLCKFLTTTRERTRLPSEWVLDLHGLPYAENSEEFQETDAVRLFEQRARQRLAAFSLKDQYHAVVRICQLVQGHPLAIELAASWIRMMTAAEIAVQISQSYQTLSTDLRQIPQRHRTIQAVFDSSWNRLSADEQSVLRRLAVFRAGCSLEAARQISGASLPILSALVEKSLLSLDTRSNEITRYSMHELVFQYALDQLNAAGETEPTKDQHLAYFLGLAEHAQQFWDTALEGEWLERLEAERGNLLAALGWALERGKTEIVFRLNGALFTFWIYKSTISEANRWLEIALALAWDPTQPALLPSRAKVLNVAGYSAVMTAQYELASQHFEEGLGLYSRLERQPEIAWSLRGCSFVAMLQGDYARALPYIEKSLAICQEVQDEWGLAWSVYDLGFLELARGRWTNAQILLEKAHRQFQALGILWGEYRAMIALGDALRGQEQWSQASIYYRNALVFQQRYQFGQHLAGIFEGLAQIALARADGLRAARLFGAAQDLRNIEMPRGFHQEADFQRGYSQLQAQISPADLAAAWAEGCAKTVREAAAYALEDEGQAI